MTFSEKQEVYDAIHKGLSRGMSHQIAIAIRSYHSRVILTTVDIKCMFQHIFKIFLLTPHEKSPKIPNFSIKIKQKPQCLNKTFITLAITLGKATSLTR